MAFARCEMKMLRAARVRAVVAATATVLFALMAGSAAAQYPSPLPDFAHPGAPHSPLMSTTSGNNDRPLLVIVADFDDVTEQMTAAQAQARFFGSGFGSVANYFSSQSSGKFTFTPAAESQGTANDGVIVAPVGKLADIQTGNGDLGGPWGRQAVLAANSTDSWINFKSFDRNNDSNIDASELVIAVVTDTGDGSSCGGTRTISDVTVDTVNLNGRQYSFDFALENVLTSTHELAHQTFSTQDQFYTAGPYDITGPTCSATNPQPSWFYSMNSWHKLHLGWKQPDVVTRDGYYDVPDWTSNGKSFLLYDHDRGTNDYFLVENRQRGGYDQNLADTGLIVWRIADSAFDSQGFTYNLIRPDGGAIRQFYGGSGSDAFDAGDSQTPQRTMARPWQDGTASNVAVRAIGNSRATMRAYLDVRGPGVLVDTYGLDDGDTSTADVPRLSPGDANALQVPVMNTGEASDSFEFFVSAGLPAGWTATTSTTTLGAGQQQQAVLQVTPPLDARADGDYTLTIRGRSTTDSSVSTTTTVRVKVLPKVSIDDVTVTEDDEGNQDATFTVSLSEAASDAVGLSFATADDSASAPADYDVTSGSLSIGSGDTSATITVPVAGDTDVEPDEVYFVRMSGVSGGKLVDGEGRGTILTDPEPSLSIDDVHIVKKGTAARFTVELSEANNAPVSVHYATSDGTAKATADYAARSGTLDFPAGTRRRTIDVPIYDDVVGEIDEETFKVMLSSAVHANIRDGQGIARIAGLPTEGPPGTLLRCPEGTSLSVRCERDDRGRLAMTGTDGDEIFIGTNGKERIEPRGGKDVVRALGGNDLVSGGNANERLYGGDGNDRINGNGGKDRIYGGRGNDRLSGAAGRDRLYGGAGRDGLRGGGSHDRLNCGSGGRDRATRAGSDTLIDCEHVHR